MCYHGKKTDSMCYQNKKTDSMCGQGKKTDSIFEKILCDKYKPQQNI